jgi:Na+/H+-dicarboxylate symporter
MVMLGLKGVLLVYLCTLLSLSLSFAIGRLIPLKAFARFMGWLHLRKSRELVLQLEPLNPEQKLDFLLKTAPSKIIPFLFKHRYLMIALMLNLPGNAF